jgi:hypothetical protein
MVYFTFFNGVFFEAFSFQTNGFATCSYAFFAIMFPLTYIYFLFQNIFNYFFKQSLPQQRVRLYQRGGASLHISFFLPNDTILRAFQGRVLTYLTVKYHGKITLREKSYDNIVHLHIVISFCFFNAGLYVS